ncbi:PA14 domain-containing protein [Streptomyces kunmingensis]|uniref:PA14 domain-containing protein n=1 Tax=Streptomyces kunmingensis TaxID=68225 RepID=A0ABU6CR42_9ACTN|nr:PA14 domain-containing protein [Streptomyces kunmingensis]MEB3966681.1 PA14 domain-containing protein [Streptomyces kunmingensis]
MITDRFRTGLRLGAAGLSIALPSACVVLAAPSAAAAVTCGDTTFKRTFYSNTSFSGTPKKTDCDTTVDQKWTGAPLSGMATNNFSVRWSLTRDFGSGGCFTYRLAGTDGLRLYVDGTRKVNKWTNTGDGGNSVPGTFCIGSGKHTVRVDHTNWTGLSRVKFTWPASSDSKAPLAPTGITTSYSTSTGKATARWTKNRELDIAHYRVSVETSSGGVSRWTTTGTSASYALPKDGRKYRFCVQAVDKWTNYGATACGPYVTPPDTTAPPVPDVRASDVTVSELLDGPRVNVWLGQVQPSEGPVFALWRATAAAGPFTEVATMDLRKTPGEQYLYDEAPGEGKTYYYAATAADAAGNISARTTPVKVSTPDTTAPGAVTGLAAEADTDRTVLTWNVSSDGAVRWEVYGAEGGAAPALLGTASAAEYRDTTAKPGVRRTYTVYALDAAGNRSKPVTVTGQREVAPAMPVALRPDAEGRPELHIRVAANNDHSGGFRVYSGSSASTVRTTLRACAPEEVFRTSLYVEYTCALTDFGGSTDRYVTVVAVAGNGVTAGYAKAVRYDDTVAPPVPAGLAAAPEPWGTTLRWGAPAVADLHSYWLRAGRPETVDGVRTCAGGSSETLAGGATSFQDTTGVPDGEERCWELRAVDGANNYSEAVTVYAAEQDTRPAEVTAPGSPVTGLEAAENAGDTVLNWDTLDGATGYRVYRWDRAAGSYERIAEGALENPYSEEFRHFRDEHAPAGTAVYYRVSAVYADGTESAPALAAVALAPTL